MNWGTLFNECVHIGAFLEEVRGELFPEYGLANALNLLHVFPFVAFDVKITVPLVAFAAGVAFAHWMRARRNAKSLMRGSLRGRGSLAP